MAPTRVQVSGTIGVALDLARYHRRPLFIAVIGVAAAVVLTATLGGLWHGANTHGGTALDATNRDLWMAPPLTFAPGSVGGVDNQLLDAHTVVRDVRGRPGVREAEALGFQSVYISTDGEAFTTVVGVGITGTTAPIQLDAGPGFEQRDVHYAEGSYDGPMTRRVVVDQGLAAALDLDIGDTLHVGGTIAEARRQRFEVAGVSPTFSSFVGARTVILHLAELQTVTGSTGTDPAAIVAITLDEGTEPESVARDLEAAYPAYEVRTNADQFETVLRRQTPIIASAAAIAIVGASIGAVLVVTVLAQLVVAQRAELAALRAVGISGWTLAGLVGLQGLVVGLVGGLLGLAATWPIAAGLNRLVTGLVGTEDLVLLPPGVVLPALGLAIALGVAGAAVAGWLVRDLDLAIGRTGG